MRLFRRRPYPWGGPAWTDPIPIHPRMHGAFRSIPWRAWTTMENTRTGDVFLVRADRGGEWAEVRRLPAP